MPEMVGTLGFLGNRPEIGLLRPVAEERAESAPHQRVKMGSGTKPKMCIAKGQIAIQFAQGVRKKEFTVRSGTKP